MKYIVGLFDSMEQAHLAVDELQRLGIGKSDISVMSNNATPVETGTDSDKRTKAGKGAGIGASTGAVAGGAAGILASLGLLAVPGIGWLLAAGPIVATLAGAGVGAATGGIIGGLVGMGIPEEDAEQYEEGIRRGGTVVTAHINDNQTQEATAIFERHHAVDIDKRAQEWRGAGWRPRYGATTSGQTSRSAATAAAARPLTRTSNEISPARRADDTAQRVPVVDEKITVGKRAVDTGGVRLYTHITQQPVEQQVKLRKETVHVERRPADRPANASDLNAFKEGQIEMRETSEEAVIQKQARVTGEVVVRKDVEQRQETVRDQVRHTDVKVEKLDSGGAASNASRQ